jgi:hypothetical protein
MSKGFDERCYDLAEYFFDGEHAAFDSKANRDELAQAIQDTIERTKGMQSDEMKGKGLCLECGELALPKCYSEDGRREVAISGLCEPCFDALCGEDEDSPDAAARTAALPTADESGLGHPGQRVDPSATTSPDDFSADQVPAGAISNEARKSDERLADHLEFMEGA